MFTRTKRYGGGSASITIAMAAELLAKLNSLAEETGQSRNSIVVEAIASRLIKEGRMKAGESGREGYR